MLEHSPLLLNHCNHWFVIFTSDYFSVIYKRAYLTKCYISTFVNISTIIYRYIHFCSFYSHWVTLGELILSSLFFVPILQQYTFFISLFELVNVKTLLHMWFQLVPQGDSTYWDAPSFSFILCVLNFEVSTIPKVICHSFFTK